ncbi:GIY-YIG nuclease family protein [Bacillus cereus]|uniref:GIY-YIG nuclease family protein n=1 Tax=Bacillus cereus TaxID=1396 RepID=UPI002D776654|nr:GIY-YIG nuclease family protein [Bacillus cereus]
MTQVQVEELVYGYKGNETFLTLYLSKITLDEIKKVENRGGVYMIYDLNGELMYVGESKRLYGRIKDHFSMTKGGKKEINKETIGHVLYSYVGVDRYERAVIEGLLVNKYKPALNCNDEMMSKAHAFVDEAIVKDIIYYTRNTPIRDYIVAKAMQVDVETVTNIKRGQSYSHVQIEKDYTPVVKISKEFVEKEKHFSNKPVVTKEMFNTAKELLEEGLYKQSAIAKKLGVSGNTLTRIKNLDYPKYQKWEAERTGKAVA